jgi:7,8-dihydropterin-6-yl-methyl-4-(beta-D-ribofuranosyl)aminobenzene 5'-phosphate synthase
MHKWYFRLALAAAVLPFLLSQAAALPSKAGTVTISILYDNTVGAEGCRSDWGFACLIEGSEKTILFDTGTQSGIFFHNAETMKKDLSKVDLVVISHNHQDHTGSLLEFLRRYGRPKLSVYLPHSSPPEMLAAVTRTGAEVFNSKEPVVLCQSAQLTGELTNGVPEQALIVAASGGLIVITGCAHPGIVEILERTKELRKEPIQLVLGGFHLMEHKAPEIEKIISRFRALGVQSVGATHCTGDEAIAMMRRAYGQNFVELGAGRVITR